MEGERENEGGGQEGEKGWECEWVGLMPVNSDSRTQFSTAQHSTAEWCKVT